MEPKRIRKTIANGPEAKIQSAVLEMLTLKGWYVKVIIGNEFQNGLPDILATHSRYGVRFIEIKNPIAYAFTPAQMDTFPKLVANGCGVWILIAATEEEYQKLFKQCNWWQYCNVWK